MKGGCLIVSLKISQYGELSEHFPDEDFSLDTILSYDGVRALDRTFSGVARYDDQIKIKEFEFDNYLGEFVDELVEVIKDFLESALGDELLNIEFDPNLDEVVLNFCESTERNRKAIRDFLFDNLEFY